MSVKQAATYDDLLKIPEDKVAEIVEGELYASPRPRTRHAHVGALLTAELVDAFHTGRRGPAGWWILYKPELHLGSDILVPDLAGWRRETLPMMHDVPALDIAPDWACEILSPSTVDLDLQRKLPAYDRHQVGWIWLIDPGAKKLEVFRRGNTGWASLGLHRENDRVHAEPFDAVEIDLSPLWLN